MTPGPAPHEVAIKALSDARGAMHARFLGIGEPLVDLPVGDLSAYTDGDGELHVVIPMNQLIYVIDRILRAHVSAPGDGK